MACRLLALLLFALASIGPCGAVSMLADEYTEQAMEFKGLVVIIRLNNGDLLTGEILSTVDDEEFGPGIVMETALGEATVFTSQIAEIRLRSEHYRHTHRIFLMPTAAPIGDNHFIGAAELVALYGGFGIADIASITFARSFIPTLDAREQVSMLNAKITLYEQELEGSVDNMSLALGVNSAWLNSNNRFLHLYGVATFERPRSTISLVGFAKIGSRDLYNVSAGDRLDPFRINYPDGAVGVGIGLDTRFTQYNGLHFIGELWNSDVGRPTNTTLVLGLRLSNSDIAADFGIAVFTQPAAAPFMSFVWTPF